MKSKIDDAEDTLPHLLTDDDMKTLLIALAGAHGQRGCNSAQAATLLAWAETAARSWAVLKLILRGDVEPAFDGYLYGEDDLEFRLTAQGKARRV